MIITCVAAQMFYRVADISHTIYFFLHDRNLTNCYSWVDENLLLLKCLYYNELVDINVQVIRKIHYI